MALLLSHPDREVEKVVAFIAQTFRQQHKSTAVIAVSGGIDSALSLSLVTQSLGPDQVVPVFLPFGDQSTADAELIASWNHIPESNWRRKSITTLVDAAVTSLELEITDTNPDIQLRIGNIMARTRMILLYDLAKELNALISGTENRSEKYLGYFTRFGDEASDLEPIQHLYKTQVRQLAAYLEIPEAIINKAPSAGLWSDQTDESELGFPYEVADQVLEALVDQKQPVDQIALPEISSEQVHKVAEQVAKMTFKHQVPYVFSEENHHD